MSNKRLVVPQARAALEQFKIEVAKELGLSDKQSIDSGYMASYHTGQITKKLVEIGERALVNNNKKKQP